MARAYSVWVVCDEQRTPIVPFTVRHECTRWLRTRMATEGWQTFWDQGAPPKWVAKMQDGVFLPTLPVWDVEDFIKEFD